MPRNGASAGLVTTAKVHLGWLARRRTSKNIQTSYNEHAGPASPAATRRQPSGYPAMAGVASPSARTAFLASR